MFVRILVCLALAAACAQTKTVKTPDGKVIKVDDLCANTPLAVENVSHSPYGHVVWNTLLTETPNQSWSFYQRLFGWTKKRMSKDSEMISANKVAFANIRKPQQKGKTSWGVSFGVENLEATLAVIEKNGGKKIGDIIPLGKWGRVVTVEDPQGDVFSIQEVPAGQMTAPHGIILWNELHATQSEQTINFYKTVFNWDSCQNKMPNDNMYTRFVRDGVRVAGFFEHKAQLDIDVSQRWVPHFQVKDLAAMTKKALKLKAKLLFPQRDIPTVGSFGVFEDSKGARFVMFQPAPEFK